MKPLTSGGARACGRPAVLVVSVLACAVFGARLDAAVSLSVSPIRVEVNAPPGETKTDVVMVENRSEEPLRLHVTIADWHLSPDGTPVFVKRGKELAFSMSGWVEVNPTELEVPPLGKVPLRYTVSVPDGTPAGGYRSAILIESLPQPLQQPLPAMAYLNARIGVILYDRVGTPTPNVEIAAQDVVRDPGAPDGLALRVTVRNAGRVHARVSGAAHIVGLDGRETDLGAISDVVVLPESERYVFVPFAQPLPGDDFRVVTRLDAGLPELLEAETTIVSKSSR